MAPLFLPALAACASDEAPEPTLAQVSEEIQFASVERLGAHHYLATQVREDSVGGEVASQVEETVDIRWQGWDDFEYRRIVDGNVASAVRVVGGRAWVRRGQGKWSRKDDAEPYRVQIRTTWNAWEQALELFLDRIAYVDEGSDVVEGRPAQRYGVRLGPPPERPPGLAKRRAAEGEPVSLEGTVWLDEATAVRLKADVTGVWRRDDHQRTVTLRLTRSAVGEDQGIRRPGRGAPGEEGEPTAPEADEQPSGKVP